MRVYLQISTVTRKTFTLTKLDLLSLINKNMEMPRVPADATLTVAVPGGGDWSNSILDVNDVGGVVVSWTEREEATSATIPDDDIPF
jgi:hypothetical protein